MLKSLLKFPFDICFALLGAVESVVIGGERTRNSKPRIEDESIPDTTDQISDKGVRNG